MTAWLVTWEWVGEHAKVKDKIVTILNYRLSGQKVLKIVELLYVNYNYILIERLAYAKNTKNNPYPAAFEIINGKIWEGRIICGDNPHLVARIVDNLKVVKGENGVEELAWEERAIPKSLTKQE